VSDSLNDAYVGTIPQELLFRDCQGHVVFVSFRSVLGFSTCSNRSLQELLSNLMHHCYTLNRVAVVHDFLSLAILASVETGTGVSRLA